MLNALIPWVFICNAGGECQKLEGYYYLTRSRRALKMNIYEKMHYSRCKKRKLSNQDPLINDCESDSMSKDKDKRLEFKY